MKTRRKLSDMGKKRLFAKYCENHRVKIWKKKLSFRPLTSCSTKVLYN